jgi:hypothetical protein
MGRLRIVVGAAVVLAVAVGVGVFAIRAWRPHFVAAPRPRVADPEPPGRRVGFRYLSAGSALEGPESAVETVITSPQQFAAAWKTLHRHLLEASPSPPPLDFQLRTYVLVSMGRKDCNGFSLQVADVRAVGGRLFVQYVEREPPDCSAGNMVAYPFSVVEIDSPPMPVSFRAQRRWPWEQ